MGASATPESLLLPSLAPIECAASDHDALLERVGAARFVLLGEATHGSHEIYRERARFTKHLIEDKGFDAVAIEADWPNAHRVNRFVQGASEDAGAEAARGNFGRFPSWMWRNAEVVDFVGWLRDHNDRRAHAVRRLCPRRPDGRRRAARDERSLARSGRARDVPLRALSSRAHRARAAGGERQAGPAVPGQASPRMWTVLACGPLSPSSSA